MRTAEEHPNVYQALKYLLGSRVSQPSNHPRVYIRLYVDADDAFLSHTSTGHGSGAAGWHRTSSSQHKSKIVQPKPPQHTAIHPTPLKPPCSQGCAVEGRRGKIISGGDADISEYPYQLQLALGGSQACGAAIISRDWAITAAHCVHGTRKTVTLRAGSTLRNQGGVVHAICETILHDLYNDETYNYDIALLKVCKPFEYGPTVQPIRLPASRQRVACGCQAVVSGWGYLEENSGVPSKILQHLEMPIVSQKECTALYKTVSKNITNQMLCASSPTGGDSCQGDSGGPLVIDGTLIGIVSWGRGCALPDFPGVYTRVPIFRHWIKEKTGI